MSPSTLRRQEKQQDERFSSRRPPNVVSFDNAKKKHNNEIEYELPALLPAAKEDNNDESQEYELPALLPAIIKDKHREEVDPKTALRLMETLLDSSQPSLTEATDFTESTTEFEIEPAIVRESTTTSATTTKPKRRSVRFDDTKTVVHEFPKVTTAERHRVWYNKHEEARMMQLEGNSRNSIEMVIDRIGFASVRSSLQGKFGNVAAATARRRLSPEERRRQQVLQASRVGGSAGVLHRVAFLLAFLALMIAFVVFTTPSAKEHEAPMSLQQGEL